MSRTTAAVLEGMTGNLPPGWIWPAAGAPSLIAAVLSPFAEEIAGIEAAAEAMMAEIDPRTATLCIADFERVLGADPCGRDPSGLALVARQRLAHQRWTARGGQSIAYFVALAAARGVEITVSEAFPSQAGRLRAGDELVMSPEQYVWIINLALGAWQVFRAGEAAAGDRLYDFALSDIECDIRRARPAHTEVAFRYVEVAGTTLAIDDWGGISGVTVPDAAISLSIVEI